MLDELIKKLMEEPSEEEKQMADILKPICVQDYHSFRDRVLALQYFRDIEPALIISKVNVVCTPLSSEAMFNVH